MSNRQLKELPQNFYTNAVTLYGLREPSQIINYILGKGQGFDILRAFANPVEYLVSMMVYPFDVRNCFTQYESTSDLLIGGRVPVNLYDKHAYALITPRSVNNYGGGLSEYGNVISDDITFTRKYNDFRDYTPYTRIKLFLPYYGYVELEPSEVYSLTIRIIYNVDFYTGGLHITLWDVTNDRIFNQYDGRIGFNVPLSSNNASEMTRASINAGLGAITTALSIGVGVATGGMGSGVAIAGGIAGVSRFTTEMANASTKHMSVRNYGDNAYTLTSSSYAFILYEHVKVPANFDFTEFAHTHGKPLMNVRTLSTLSGYTRCGESVLTGFGNATNEELQLIREKLSKGIIL